MNAAVFSTSTELKSNIISSQGSFGLNWIKNLPNTIQALADKWSLKNIRPVENMTWNYVGRATSEKYGSVILKISCTSESIKEEITALKHFSGYQIAELFNVDSTLNALLLREANPGRSLCEVARSDTENSLKIYTCVVNSLISTPQTNQSKFKTVSHWLQALDHANTKLLPDQYLKYAIKLKNRLLSEVKHQFVLHGDLHLDNIIEDKTSWISIDPKGIVGPIAFEAAKFDFCTFEELKNDKNVPELFEKRTKTLASYLNINHQTLKDWVYVRNMLAASWAVEDKISPDIFLSKINKYFY